jgi:hypothetical protein
VGSDRGDVAVVIEEIAARAEAAGEGGVVDESLHGGGERDRGAMGEEQAVDFVVYVLGHATGVGGDDGHSGLLGFMDDEGGVFDPDRGYDDGIDPVEDIAHDVGVAIFGEPFDALGGLGGQRACEGLQGRGLLSAGAAPDAEAGVALQGVTLQTAKGTDEVVDAFGRDVGADVAEGEGLVGAAGAAGHALAVEAIVEVLQLGFGQCRSRLGSD